MSSNIYTIPGTNLIKFPQQLFPIELMILDHDEPLTEDFPMAAFQVIWAYPPEDDPIPVYDTEILLPISIASDDPFPFRNERLELRPLEKRLKSITVDYVYQVGGKWLNAPEFWAIYSPATYVGLDVVQDEKWVITSFELEA